MEGVVGRDREVSLLDELLEQPGGDRARFVFVEGEPGIGKTALLDVLATTADRQGRLLLEGHGTELEQESPFGVFVDALDDYLLARADDLRRRLDPEVLDELAGVFPSLRSGLQAIVLPGPDERVLAYRAIATLLEVLAEDGPTVVVLDDLHWADRGSLELLSHLLRRRPRGPILIAGAYRTGRIDPGFAGDVATAVGTGEAVDIVLGPLDRVSAALLLAGSTADHRRLYEESGGNPFYLLQLARGPLDSPSAAVVQAGPSGVPAAVRHAIARELAGLSPTARRMIEVAAVAGDPFELDLVAEVVDLEDGPALAALDEMAGIDLVRPTAVPREFRFRHPLVRSSVYAGTSPGTRLEAHARCAQLLAARGAPAATRAHHVEHAAKHGDHEAVAVLAAAAGEVGGRAPASATRWTEAALRLLSADAPDSERLGLLLTLPGLHAAIGELDRARRVLVEAIDLVPPDQRDVRAQLIAACAAVEQATGHHGAAQRRLTAAIETLEDDEGPDAVALLVARTANLGFNRAFDEMRDLGLRTVVAARRVEDLALRASAIGVAAMGCAFAGDADRALGLRDEAAALVDALADEQLGTRLEAVGHLCAAELYLDRYESSAAHAARGVRIGRATGQSGLAPMLLPCLGTSMWVLGRLEESIAVFDEAVESARLARQEQALVWALLNLALPLVLAGDVDTALRCAREAVDGARSLDDSVVLSWAGMSLGRVELEAGDPAAALHTMVSTSGETGEAIPGAWRLFCVEHMVRATVATDADRAGALARFAQERGEEIGLPLGRTWGLRSRARVDLAAGAPGTAAELALASAEPAKEAGARLEVAQSWAIAGDAFAAAGDRDRATALLRDAAAAFDTCGAVRLRQDVERALGRLGRRAHRRSQPGTDTGGVAALTGRELEVARLVVDRRTNAEIADALYLSTKTVETHLRNIFRKLDVTSRTEVARALERHEAAG